MRNTLLAIALLTAPVTAQTLDTEVVSNGFTRPVWAGAHPGDERIFVAEQSTGLIRIFDGSAILATPFLDLSGVIDTSGGERGLLGVALHPKFHLNGTFFVHYTTPAPIRSIVARYQVSAGNPDVADAGSGAVLFDLPQPAGNHNSATMAFSPVDGYMYVGVADGGGVNCNSQDPSVLLGKILRIDVDDQDPGLEYAIPADNPFVGVPGVREEIWAAGIRQPWRLSFDALTGDLYIGDVGLDDREEVTFEPALTPGRNYGWPVMEGDFCGSGLTVCGIAGIPAPPCFDSAYTDPVHSYSHPVDDNGTIIGGVVYRGCKLPSLQGTYLYADKGFSTFFSLEVAGGVATNLLNRQAELGDSGNNPVHFGFDGQGEILVVDLSKGRVSRVIAATPPVIADCDGNELDDPCEIATYAWADTDGSGTVDACETFSVDTAEFCMSLGGTQTMRLHAGAAHAGRLYGVLGSLTGTAPGFPFGATVVPLNFDFYTQLSIVQGNLAPFVNTIATLDGNGEAEAAFSAPAGLPTVVLGLKASHAYVVLDSFLSPVLASNYTTMEFQP